LDKNDQEIPPDGTSTQRSINSINDEMNFAVGSTVTITQAKVGRKIRLR